MKLKKLNKAERQCGKRLCRNILSGNRRGTTSSCYKWDDLSYEGYLASDIKNGPMLFGLSELADTRSLSKLRKTFKKCYVSPVCQVKSKHRKNYGKVIGWLALTLAAAAGVTSYLNYRKSA